MINHENKHERDDRIEFEPKSHTYYIDGNCEGYKSVTQFIGEFFPKFNATKVIKQNYDKWQKNPQSKYHGMKPKEIVKHWETKSKQASNKGSNLHEDIEKYLLGEKVSNSSSEWTQFINFYQDFNKIPAYRTEWFIFDEDLGLAGSIDSIFYDKENDQYIMVDWKRSNEIRKNYAWENGFYPLTHIPNTNYYKYALQLNLYSHMLRKKYDISIDKMYLVKLHPNSSNYELYSVEDMGNEINLMVRERKKVLNK